LLEAVKTDGQKFFDMVCHSRNATLEYEDIPIFAYVDPAEFVDAWLESPKTGWYWIGNALKERHKVLTQYPALASERAWYPQVHKEMLRRARSQEGLARIRMERAAELMGIPKAASTASLARASAKAPVKPKVAAAVPATSESEVGAVPAKPKRARKKPE
jgi:hypothetical protein